MFGVSAAAPASSLNFGASAPSGFGATAPSGFGAPAPSGFGAPAPSGFGAPAPSGFGASTPAFGGFGTHAPAPSGFGSFGAPAPSAFGGIGAPAPSAFGSFAERAPAPSAFGGFGTQARSSLGGFGATATAPSAFGGFGATATAPTAFGGAPAPAPSAFGLFGAPTPAPTALGGFGTYAPTQAAFGAAPAPVFSGFGGFGAPAPAPSAFGSFGAPTPSTFGGFGIPAPAPGALVPFGQTYTQPSYDADTLYESLPEILQQKVREVDLEIQKQRRVAEELSLATDDHIYQAESEAAVLRTYINETEAAVASALATAIKLKSETAHAADDVERFGRAPAHLLRNPSGLHIVQRMPSPYLKNSVTRMEESASACSNVAKNVLHQLTMRRSRHALHQDRDSKCTSIQLSKVVRSQHTVLIQVAGKLASIHAKVNDLRAQYLRSHGGEDVFEAADRAEKAEELRSTARQHMKIRQQQHQISGSESVVNPAGSTQLGSSAAGSGGFGGFGTVPGSGLWGGLGAMSAPNASAAGGFGIAPSPALGGFSATLAPNPSGGLGSFGSAPKLSGFGGLGPETDSTRAKNSRRRT